MASPSPATCSASPRSVTRARVCGSARPSSACTIASETRGSASMSCVCHASRLTRTYSAPKSASGRYATIDTSGASWRKVPSAPTRTLRISRARAAEASASIGAIVVFSRHCALRIPHRPALHARQAPQPLHQLHLPHIDGGDRARGCRADRGAVGHERLPAGAARAHPRRGVARAARRRRRATERLAADGRRRGAQPARRLLGAVRQRAGHAHLRPGRARRHRARHPAARGGAGGAIRQAHARRQPGGLAGGPLRRRARRRPGARAGRSARRQGGADRAAGAGDAGRGDPAPEAVHRGRHLRRRLHRGRRRACADQPAGRAEAVPDGRRGERGAPEAGRPVRRARSRARAELEARPGRSTPPTGRAATPTSSARSRSRSGSCSSSCC